MPTSVEALNNLDLALLGLVLLSVLVGALRGLLFEVMTLAGWLIAYAAAYLYSPRLLPWLPGSGAPGPTSADSAFSPAMLPLIAFVLCFFGVLIAWGLLAQLLRAVLRATPLSGIDRLLGFGFGLLRAALLMLALAAVVALTPWAKSRLWQESLAVPWLNAGLLAAKPLLPPGVARWLAH